MLEALYQDFLSLSHEDQALFVRAYREQRTNEVEASRTRHRSEAEGGSQKVLLSAEERALMKKLGITVSAIKDIRNDVEDNAEEVEDGLFED